MVEVSSRILVVDGAAHDGAHGFESGKTGHEHVEQQNIGLQLQSLLDGLIAVSGLADHFEPIVLTEHVAHADANHRVVIRYNDSNRSIH